MTMVPWLLVVLELGYLLMVASSSIPSHNATASWVATVYSHNVTTASWVDSVPSHNESAETLEDAEGSLVEEGDVIVSIDRNAVNEVWSNATVPYRISPELRGRSAEILQAFKMISSSTCIRFVPHQKEWSYIYIRAGKGCASPIGRRGGRQPLFFGPSCSVGNIVHELIHTLGLYHEHNRDDRDRYVSINWSKILPDEKNNFNIKHGNTLNQPYDYHSIMHYGPSYFSVDGSPTIVSKKRQAIGQREHLSDLDIKKLKILYHC